MNRGNTNFKYPYETPQEWVTRYVNRPAKISGYPKKLNRSYRRRRKEREELRKDVAE